MANNQSRPPRRGPMGPGMGPGVGEKAKDFKSAVKRLVKELGKFKIKKEGSETVLTICTVLDITNHYQ